MSFRDFRTGNKTNSGQLVATADGIYGGGVIIRALSTNTGTVEVRGYASLDVDGVPTANGPILQPGDSMTVPVENPAQIYLVMTVITDSVRYLYVFDPPVA
jgi:hypothetical protein